MRKKLKNKILKLIKSPEKWEYNENYNEFVYVIDNVRIVINICDDCAFRRYCVNCYIDNGSQCIPVEEFVAWFWTSLHRKLKLFEQLKSVKKSSKLEMCQMILEKLS
jgi:hypothetical protein